MATQQVELMGENKEAKEMPTPDFYSTDDESTGQKCSTNRDKVYDKILAKTKSDSMFELRKLTYQHKPVSEFGSKDALLEHLASRQPPPAHDQQASARQDGAGAESGAEELEVPAVDISARVQQLEPRAEGEVLTEQLRPEGIQQDMQVLQELRVVNEILQGPVHEEIDQTLRNEIERREARQRPRPRPRPRPPRPEREEGGEEGGDEMSQPPVGRLMAAGGGSGGGGRARRQRGNRRVRFRPQIPTPNADGRYPVPARDQSVIVERLRQSPALNSLGDEARDEVVAEVGNLVSQQLVTSALSGEFRGVLELHIQSRAESIHRGQIGPPSGRQLGRQYPQQEAQYSDEEDRRPGPTSSAAVRELREDMLMVKGQLSELKQMMRVSFDLQLDIQRAIRQEVAAALTAFLSQQQPMVAAGGGGGAVCPVPTLAPPEQAGPSAAAGRSAGGARVHAVESGHCVICSEGVIDSVMYHCGHMCTCTACGLELKSKALKCPICRAPISDVIRAYTSML